MAHGEYYPEEVLVEKVQAGEYGWTNTSATAKNGG